MANNVSAPEELNTVSGASRVSLPEVSIVLPCLNEADTIAVCIAKARDALREHRIDGEIIVADNGSSDASRSIAREMGATVVDVSEKGYGNALMGGIAAARGKYVIMADADDSYDLRDLPQFVQKLREGYELVQGCRLERGGGRVLPGAMPFLHRWWGNPMFSWLARRWFDAATTDVYCGFRAFTRDLFYRLDQRCTGMEFATEMIIKASLLRARVSEVPITLHPDGRRSHPPHLRRFRDGWRTLRFFLMYCPRWLFVLPGGLLILLGVLGYVAALPGLRIGGAVLDAHTLLVASLSLLCGYQTLLIGLFTKVFAATEGLLPENTRLTKAVSRLTVERGLIAGGCVSLLGAFLLALAVNQWRQVHFGALDYTHTMRLVVPGVTLAALGFQTVVSSFFLSILWLRRR